MEGLFDSVVAKVLTGGVVAGLALVAYLSLDIYLALTGRDFGNVNVQVMYFTRNDHDHKADALHFRILGFKIPLRGIYRNRLLFWRLIYTSLAATAEKPVLHFGEYAYALLTPLRGRVLTISASMELKRAAGLPFRQTKYQMAVVYDRSEDKRNYVRRVVLVRDEDLRNFQFYLDRPPQAGENFALLKKVEKAYREDSGSFLPVQIVTA